MISCVAAFRRAKLARIGELVRPSNKRMNSGRLTAFIALAFGAALAGSAPAAHADVFGTSGSRPDEYCVYADRTGAPDADLDLIAVSGSNQDASSIADACSGDPAASHDPAALPALRSGRGGLRATAAVRLATQQVARHRAHRHLHRRHAAARHELAARTGSRTVPPLPVPARSHAPQQPARVPGSHFRVHDGHTKSSARHAAAFALMLRDALMPLGPAPDLELGTMNRIDIWRSEGRGPPRAAPDRSLLTVLARRPSFLASGARSSYPASVFTAVTRVARARGASALRPPASLVSPAGRLSLVGATVTLPQAGEARRAPSLFQEARSGLPRLPLEGTAAEVLPPFSNGGCT